MDNKIVRITLILSIGIVGLIYANIYSFEIFDFFVSAGIAPLLAPLMWLEEVRLLNPLWGIPIFFVCTHITNIDVTVFLHREQAHKALLLHPALRHFFKGWLWFKTTMTTKEWVAVHRKHHAKCETEEDPHSPQQLGLATIILDGVKPYIKEAKNKETLEKYGKGTPDDWLERNIYSHKNNRANFIGTITSRRYWGVILMWVLYLWLFGLSGLGFASLEMIWIPIVAAGGINGLGHALGYRNFETNDESRNIVPLGIVLAGEELHNNHHAFPRSASFEQRSWEFDIGYWYIRKFELFRLAKVNKERLAPRSFEEIDSAISAQSKRWTWIDFRKGEMHLLRKFGVDEIKPTLKREKLKRKFKKMLRKHPNMLTDEQRKRLREFLDSAPRLNTLYAAWIELHESLGAREKMEAWCKKWKDNHTDFVRFFERRFPESDPPLVR